MYRRNVGEMSDSRGNAVQKGELGPRQM